MPEKLNPKPTSATTPTAVHHSTFAEGESHPNAHPEEEHVGTFAEGECEPDAHPGKGTTKSARGQETRGLV